MYDLSLSELQQHIFYTYYYFYIFPVEKVKLLISEQY